MLMQLPTPELCIRRTPLSPPSHAPESMAMPSSSVVRVTTTMALSARQRRMRWECPASGTRATWRIVVGFEEVVDLVGARRGRGAALLLSRGGSCEVGVATAGW